MSSNVNSFLYSGSSFHAVGDEKQKRNMPLSKGKLKKSSLNEGLDVVIRYRYSTLLITYSINTNFSMIIQCLKIEAADVGPLLKIRVGHDGAGAFAGWFLDKVIPLPT